MNPIDDEKKIEDGPEEKGEFGREREHFCKNFIKNQKKIGQSFRGPRCLFFFFNGRTGLVEPLPQRHIYKTIHIQKNIKNDEISAISATSAKIRHIQDNREQNR